MRKGILTSSTFKDACASRDLQNTAERLLGGSTLDENMPMHIEFGKRFENKARNMFLAGHRYRHRKGLKHNVPGLIISNKHAFLGTSPDGIFDCKTCGKALIEIKCLSSKRNFYPKSALLLLGICEKSENGELIVKKSHRYFYQVQGQMALTGIHRCYFVAYTHKGIYHILVNFDQAFWDSLVDKLQHFYRSVYCLKFKDYVTSDMC